MLLGLNKICMNNKFTKAENTPNAGKLMESLRNSGYKDEVAVADLVDNSIDADAREITITVDEGKNKRLTITILDNGRGMNEAMLAQALRLGSISEKNSGTDLGKFGMGLVTASISVTRRLEVYTKTTEGELLTGILDIDEIKQNNAFEVHRGLAEEVHTKIAKEFGLSEHGTLIILRDCDTLSTTNLNELVDKISNHFGEIFRYFIRGGVKMIINGKKIEIKDPMWEDGILVEEYKEEAQTTLVSDEKYTLTTKEGEVEDIRIRIFQIPQFDKATNRKLKINQTNQGFYLLRNYRQIAKGLELGRFTKHNSLNRVRIEVLFSDGLDNEMGVNFSKHNLNLTQKLNDLIDQNTFSTVETLKKRHERSVTKEKTDELGDGFKSTERSIKSNSKLLQVAPIQKSKTEFQSGKKLVQFLAEVNKEKSQSGKKIFSDNDLVKFGAYPFTASGPIIDVEKEGRTTIVIWNTDHPFYKTFVLDNGSNKDLFNAVNSFAYVLAEAKLQYSIDDSKSKMLDDMIITMSSNLRILLS